MDSPRQMLANTLLGYPVQEYIAAQRAEGVSWRRIAQMLRDDTRGVIDVTDQTLRTWVK